jgi:DNA polymerase I-like protein with 3'-5' exonuclease and polymerase domains
MTKKVQPTPEHEPAATTWEYESINTEVASRKKKPAKRRGNSKWAEQVAKLAEEMRLKQDEQDRIQGAAIVATIHDEIVVECQDEDAGEVLGLTKTAMLDGISKVAKDCPAEVEGGTGASWGAAK